MWLLRMILIVHAVVSVIGVLCFAYGYYVELFVKHTPLVEVAPFFLAAPSSLLFLVLPYVCWRYWVVCLSCDSVSGISLKTLLWRRYTVQRFNRVICSFALLNKKIALCEITAQGATRRFLLEGPTTLVDEALRLVLKTAIGQAPSADSAS
jgi:hypothetical protein